MRQVSSALPVGQRNACSPIMSTHCFGARRAHSATHELASHQHQHAPVHAPPQQLRRTHRRAPPTPRASSSSPSPSSQPPPTGGGAPVRKQLPIFPLSVVALPNATVPLMIFEPRYRVLFSTLLAGADGVDEGLVQADSPFKGSRRFGMCFADERGRLATIGTTLEIQEFVRQQDGRMYVTNCGVERFRITGVVQERPVLICDVEVLPEDEDDSPQARELAGEVAELFRNTLRLHLKMQRAKRTSRDAAAGERAASAAAGVRGAAPMASEDDDPPEPEELAELPAWKLSYWIAHVFQESRLTQQSLLEENSTLVRLTREKEVLEGTLRFYSAATALESVFSGGSSSAGSAGSEPVPPPGGPD